MIVLVALAAAQVLVIGSVCLLSAGGDPWQEPTVEPMPDVGRLVRWPLPARHDLN